MLLVLSDTHCETGPTLTPHLETQIDAADGVVHAGDFTTGRVLDVFEALASEFWGVAGNSDTGTIHDRLSETCVLDWKELRVVVAHGHDHDATKLSLFARQESADIAVVGHTHRPGIDTAGDLPVVNPGSHADPRGNDPTYAVIDRVENGYRLSVRTVTGETVQSVQM